MSLWTKQRLQQRNSRVSRSQPAGECQVRRKVEKSVFGSPDIHKAIDLSTAFA